MSPGAPSRPSFEFDAATHVRPRGDGVSFDLDIDTGWTVGLKPNGGYLLAAIARAVGDALGVAESPHRDPLAATAHFLWAPDPGPATVMVEVLRVGRGASQARASLLQGDRACVEASFTMGLLPSPPPPPWWSDRELFTVPPRSECIRLPAAREGAPFEVPIMNRTDLRLDPASLAFTRGELSGRADLRGWVSFADDRPVDALALLFFLDALPPATFGLAFTGWVPTLSLTAYVRACPAPGPLRIRQTAHSIDDHRVDEVCEIWDSTDRLVGQATQLAAIRIPEGTDPPT
jgi:hypothetical protein